MESFIEESSFIDKIIENKVIRFFLSAGIGMLVDVIIYYLTYTYILKKQSLQIIGQNASAHSFSLVVSYSCGVVTNFTLTKYAVFTESNIAGTKQFFRFVLIAGIGFFANYTLLRIFVEYFNFVPTLSRVLSALSLGIASYYIHKLFTFRIKN